MKETKLKYITEGEPLLKNININTKINLKSMIGDVLLFRNLPKELQQTDSYGVPDSDWQEPIDLKKGVVWCDVLLEEFKHLPFESSSVGYVRPMIGIQCDGKNWYRIKGYNEPHFAPGRSWKEEYFDQPEEPIRTPILDNRIDLLSKQLRSHPVGVEKRKHLQRVIEWHYQTRQLLKGEEGEEIGEVCNRNGCPEILTEIEQDGCCSCFNHAPCGYCESSFMWECTYCGIQQEKTW